MLDSRAEWASRSLLTLPETEGKSQGFNYGMDLLAPWIENPEQWKALYKLLMRLQQAYSCRNKQECFNADLLDGKHYDDIVEDVEALIAAALDAHAVEFPLLAPSDAPAAQYGFDGGLSGMGFDQDADEGPKLQDINGDAQLIVDTNGVNIPNKLTVDGLIDPTGLELTPVAANPGGTAANTLWLDSLAANALKWGANALATTAHVASNFQPRNTNLTAIAALTSAADKVPYATGAGTWALADLSSFARSMLDDANAAAAVATLVAGMSDAAAVAAADRVIGNDDGTGARLFSFQQIWNYLTTLSAAGTLLLTSETPWNDGGTAKKTTPQALYNLINSLTAESSPLTGDKIPLYDASASQTDAITYGAFLGHSKAAGGQYTGNGAANVVTLTGVNRVYFLIVQRVGTSGSDDSAWVAAPIAGATGVVSMQRNDGQWYGGITLSAPGAGTSQTMTLTNEAVANASGGTYRYLAIGTPI